MTVLDPLKQFIVRHIETVDSLLDRVPSIERIRTEPEDADAGVWTFRVYRNGLWGCRWQIASLSGRLDDRWNTHVWVTVPYNPEETP